jgi:rubrerythrin
VNGVGFWQRKTEALLSSPSRHAFESFARGTKTVLHRAELYKTELDMFQVRSIIHKQDKARARRTVQSGAQLYAHEAQAKREKEARERAKAQQKAERESQQAAKQLLQMAKRVWISICSH